MRIRRLSPKRAAGFKPVKQFAHKGKHRRSASEVAEAMHMTPVMSPWDRIEKVKKVDIDRVNWKGIVFMQTEYGMFDPKPRLVR